MGAWILSASRRTDIPAFYAKWFIHRIREGIVEVRNPFRPDQVFEISLKPEEVGGIVFWTRNPVPLFPYLDELDDRGFRFYFHSTITALPAVFEPKIPPKADALAALRTLSRRYSPDHVQWRYDPLVISDRTDGAYHIRAFERMCEQLTGATKRCYFSFVDFYGKVKRAIPKFKERTGIEIVEIPEEEKREIARRMADIAEGYGIGLYACCEDFLVDGRIQKAHCVDPEILEIVAEKPFPIKPRPTRPECGCYESRDIGAYDTCPGGCVYCYANTNKETAIKNFKGHDPEGRSLMERWV